jgi:hypothetical protein
MGNQVKEILIGAVTIAVGYALAKVVYSKFVSSSATPSPTPPASAPQM